MLESVDRQLVEVNNPTPSVKINNGDLVLFFERVPLIYVEKEKEISEYENQILTVPSDPLYKDGYNYLKSGSGFVRFKLFMSTTTGHFKVFFTYANIHNYPRPIATEVEIQ